MKNSLRIIRNAKGLTQAQLGERAGYKFQTVAAYEKLESPLPRKFLEKISKALGVSIAEIESSPDLIHEPSAPFRPAMLNLETVSRDLLDTLLKDFTHRLPAAVEPERYSLGLAVNAVLAEQRRRDVSSTEVVRLGAKVIGHLATEVENRPKSTASKRPASTSRRAATAAREKDGGHDQ